jgi:hypothetical protein
LTRRKTNARVSRDTPITLVARSKDRSTEESGSAPANGTLAADWCLRSVRLDLAFVEVA